MISDIERKISELISTGITAESQAVYLMVQIRKLLEQISSVEYPYLQFHSDWALHPRMNRATAQRILGLFNEANQLLRSGAALDNLPNELRRKIEDIFGMVHFRTEIAAFLNARSLPTLDVVRDGWTKFLWHYVNVIKDCPLQISSTDATSFIAKVTLKAELANLLQEGEQFYKITWQITDRRGTVGELFVLNSFSATS